MSEAFAIVLGGAIIWVCGLWCGYVTGRRDAGEEWNRLATQIYQQYDKELCIKQIAAALRRADKAAYRRGVEDGTSYGKGTIARNV